MYNTLLDVLVADIVVNPHFYLWQFQLEVILGNDLIPDIGDEFCANADQLNADVVHIILENMVASGIWDNPDYIADVAEMDFPYINLLNSVLHSNSQSNSAIETPVYKALLDAAPCEGPWQDPLNLENHASGNWASACNLFKGFGETGPTTGSGENIQPWKEYSGYYPGIDYMVLHNLYYLIWKEELPEYRRRVECQCMLEITSDQASTASIEVKRQFKDYRAKGIPIESYLAHNFNMTGNAAIMEVKNDFVICNSDPTIPTTLTMDAGAKLNLYDGNTITVREGNKLVIGNNAQLRAGLSDSDYDGDYPIPTIKLLANAQLSIVSGARLYTKKGLLIEMAEGSEFIIDGAICKPEYLTDLGITIINHGGTIKVINEGILHTRNHIEMVHSMINASIILDDGQFICENPTDVHAWFLQDCSLFAYHNSVFQMNGDFHLDHSTMNFNHLSDLKIREGSIRVQEGSRINWGGEKVELIGDLSYIEFDGGTMEIGPNKTFAPTHPSQPSGYIEFKGAGDHELFMNQGSVFKLEGDNSDDIMLKVVDYADMWTTYVGPNPQDAYGDHGSIQLNKCKVEMHNHGRIWTDLDFDAYRVSFISSQNEGVGDVAELRSSWENDFDLKYCNLQQVNVFGLASDLYATNCSFYDSDVKMRYGHYNINASNFQYSSLVSEAANFMCRLTGCQFMDNSCNVTDDGLVELKVDKCTFTGAALEKNDGVLGLHCNYFEGAINPVSVTNAYLSMSSSSANGYNQFYNVSTCVKMDRATGFEIDEGFNDFSGYTQCCICGSLAWSCNEPDCEMWLKTTHNFWGSSSADPFTPDYHYYPNSPNVEIHLYAQDGNNKHCNVDGEAGMGLGCTITVMDSEPIYKEECGLSKPVVRKERRTSKSPVNANVSMIHHHQLRDLSTDFGNPILGTSNFNNYTLDSALVAAALQMEVYDTLGNDAQAVAYFEEILTSGLDRSNPDVRWRMEWGRKQMKAAIENMFVDKELSASANETAFEAPVLSYVNVLNVMTDTILSGSTYKDQFCVELDKGQLFRTIGQPVLAKYVFEHLGDCQLDSLEQAKLNEWIYEVDIELATKYEFFNDSLSWDTTMVVVDSTLYPLPMDVTQSNYYFGVWIGGPQDVAFVHCGEDLQFRTFIEQTEQWNIYPNPAHDRINLSCPTDERAVIRIYDSMGRMAYQEVFNFGDQHTATIQLGQQWPAGNYMLCKETNGTAAFKRFVVAK